MLPKLIPIGSFFIPTYGVLVAIGFLIGLWITVKLAKRAGLPTEPVTNLAIYSALAGLAGAKLFMFLFDFNDYWSGSRAVFSLETLQAAGVYQGGLLLALLMAFYYMRRTRLPALATFDVFAPGIALGHAIGRIGCFAAGCCWGKECDLPWAVTFRNPAAHDLVGVPLNVPLHPTQLYESLSEAIIFAFLYWRIQKAHAAGEIFGLYLILYSIARFLVEFVRNHEQPLYLGLSITQWISLGTLAAGIWLVASRRGAPKLAVS
ncbi:MAG: prolipoprotein diacylglyceryl transferase [Bryobacteraceae bacterium]